MAFLYDMVSDFVDDVQEFWTDEDPMGGAPAYNPLDDSYGGERSEREDRAEASRRDGGDLDHGALHAATHRLQEQMRERGRQVNMLDVYTQRQQEQASSIRHHAADLRHHAEQNTERGFCGCFG